MKADALTKITTKVQRKEWMEQLNRLVVPPQKTDVEDNLTSKKRVQLPIRELKAFFACDQT